MPETEINHKSGDSADPRDEARSLLLSGFLNLLFVVVGAALVAYLMMGYIFDKASKSFYESEPRELPEVVVDGNTYPQLRTRVADFVEAVVTGTPVDPLRLDTAAINALVHRETRLRSKMVFEIADSKLGAVMALPAHGHLSGKYLNGTAELKLELTDTGLGLYFESISVDNRALSAAVLAAFSNRNLLEDYRVYGHPEELDEFSAGLDRVEVDEDHLVLVPKQIRTDSDLNA